MDSNKIGKFIYSLRKENSLSQYQLADMIPISRQAVSKWERGVTIPDSSTLLRLSEIFDVTINELLNGKRLEENSIKNLETTTLEIIDQQNIKKRKYKRTTTLLGIIILFLLFFFLLYYFITSYQSIKVYKVSGTNEKIDIYNGLFIITNEKAYLKLGKIKNRSEEISTIKLYYMKSKKKVFISYDLDIDEIVIIYNGYKENISIEDLDYILNNSYIEIETKDNKKEQIHLSYERDFVNNKLFSFSEHKLKEKNNETLDIEKNDIDITSVILYIKEKENYNDGVYTLTYLIDNEKITYIFYENLYLLRITNIEEEYIDYHLNSKMYQCNLKNNKTNNLECKNQLIKYCNWILDNRT